MNKALAVLAVLQVGIIATVQYNEGQIEKALPEAVARGRDVFNAPITQSFFSATGASLTMVNGWRSRANPNQCSVMFFTAMMTRQWRIRLDLFLTFIRRLGAL